MAASTTRLSITCFRGYPETSCEKRSRSSKTSVAFTASPTTRPACFGPTGKFCNIYTRLARSAKQEKRGEILAHTSISGVTSEQTTLHSERHDTLVEKHALGARGYRCLYSPSCREGSFSETQFPTYSIPGNSEDFIRQEKGRGVENPGGKVCWA